MFHVDLFLHENDLVKETPCKRLLPSPIILKLLISPSTSKSQALSSGLIELIIVSYTYALQGSVDIMYD